MAYERTAGTGGTRKKKTVEDLKKALGAGQTKTVQKSAMDRDIAARANQARKKQAIDRNMQRLQNAKRQNQGYGTPIDTTPQQRGVDSWMKDKRNEQLTRNRKSEAAIEKPVKKAQKLTAQRRDVISDRLVNRDVQTGYNRNALRADNVGSKNVNKITRSKQTTPANRNENSQRRALMDEKSSRQELQKALEKPKSVTARKRERNVIDQTPEEADRKIKVSGWNKELGEDLKKTKPFTNNLVERGKGEKKTPARAGMSDEKKIEAIKPQSQRANERSAVMGDKAANRDKQSDEEYRRRIREQQYQYDAMKKKQKKEAKLKKTSGTKKHEASAQKIQAAFTSTGDNNKKAKTKSGSSSSKKKNKKKKKG